MQFYGAAYNMSKRQIKQRMEELSERLSLSEFIDRISGSLPVGWRQRLALAVSLLHKPDILFLDEPTGGVDPVFRRRFWDILYRLASEGVTIFVTTHYMDEAEYCGRISIMHRGKIIKLGKPYDLVKEHGADDLEDLFIDLIRTQESGRG
jgi:ABC-2 type transport system ATP-binding protein